MGLFELSITLIGILEIFLYKIYFLPNTEKHLAPAGSNRKSLLLMSFFIPS